MKSSRTCFMTALAFCGTFSMAAMAQDPKPRPPQEKPSARAPEAIDNAQELVSKLQMLNHEEIEVGKLAMENASASEVKDYGHKLMTDHQKKQEMVEEFAQGKQLEWKDTVELPKESKDKVEKLRGLEGGAFDSAFLREMEAGHHKAIDMVEKAAESLKDAEARKLATDMLPGLKEHLELAKKLQKKPTE